MWPKFAVVWRIQVQEGAGFRLHPALKSAAVNCHDAFFGGRRGAVCIEFNGYEMSAGALGDFKQRGALADARVDGGIVL
jgi:hypothetical protein